MGGDGMSKETDKMSLAHDYKPRHTHRNWVPTGKREKPFVPEVKPWETGELCACGHNFHPGHSVKFNMVGGVKYPCLVPACGCLSWRETE